MRLPEMSPFFDVIFHFGELCKAEAGLNDHCGCCGSADYCNSFVYRNGHMPRTNYDLVVTCSSAFFVKAVRVPRERKSHLSSPTCKNTRRGIVHGDDDRGVP